MAAGPIYYVNNPVSGTQYWAPMGYGCIPNSGTSLTVTVKAWSGADGTGSLVQVTTLTAYDWDQTTNASKNSFSGNFNSVNATTSQTNGTDWFKPSGKWQGTQSVGSLSLQISSYTGTAFVPTTPSFSPTSGFVGDAVTLTGSHFTDATSVQFNGVGASFSVVSDTQISTTVPAGATTGLVSVGNPSGSASSAGAFTVLLGPAYVRRAGAWVRVLPEVQRSGVKTQASGYVRRSGAWTPGG